MFCYKNYSKIFIINKIKDFQLIKIIGTANPILAKEKILEVVKEPYVPCKVKVVTVNHIKQT